MASSQWHCRRFAAVFLLITVVTLFGCGKTEQSKQTQQSEPSKQSDQDADKTEQPTQDLPLAIAPPGAEQAKENQEACAKLLKTPVEITNEIGMKLRLIPPGEFLMGSPAEEKGRLKDEGPQHRVRLTKAFYLSATEVTQQQYQQLMGENPSHFSANGEGKDDVIDTDTGQHPVENISWFEAVEFCNRLSEQEGLKPWYVPKILKNQEKNRPSASIGGICSTFK